MIARMAKLVGYTKAPKATFMVRHPIKGVRAWRASRRGVNRIAAVGAGAAALALPAGFLYLKRRQNGY